MSEPRRWWNPHLPQTLTIAVALLYFNAVLGILGGGLSILVGAFFIVAQAGGAFGIANERRWGYRLAVFVSIVRVALIVLVVGLTGLVHFVNLVAFLFAVALVAVLVHPMSREHQRIWFK